mgnify:CR=1 FL=1
MKKIKFKLIVFIVQILFISYPLAQFNDVNVKLDLRRINDGDRHLFDSFSQNIEKYYVNTQFSPEVDDFELEIEIHFVIENIMNANGETLISAQAIFTNKSDQYFYAKGVEFPYSKGRRFYYSTEFDHLSSFLNYYAFLFIATELDGWNYLDGSSFFVMAEDLAYLGKSADHNRGWNDRWRKSKKLKDNIYLRGMRYYFFESMDAIYSEDPDYEKATIDLDDFYSNLQDLNNILGDNKETLLFLKTYHKSLSEILATLKRDEILEFLMEYDVDNFNIYKSHLTN